jgi:transposase-like protein
MQQNKRRRLSAEAWRGMVERFEGSGSSAEGFCQQEGISLASLYRWRLKFRHDASGERVKRADTPATTAEAVEFVDLGALRSSGSRLDLRLDFGGGVILQLSRG